MEFKLRAVARMEGACDVSALAVELGVGRERLYHWRRLYETRGAEALRGMGRPRAAQRLAEAVARHPDAAGPERRIAELERAIGQQQLDLDFFRAALRQLEARRRTNGVPGETTSTR
jgi:transposase-like protein